MPTGCWKHLWLVEHRLNKLCCFETTPMNTVVCYLCSSSSSWWYKMNPKDTFLQVLSAYAELWRCGFAASPGIHAKRAERALRRMRTWLIRTSHTATNLRLLLKEIVTGRLDNISQRYSTNEHKALMAPQRETCKIGCMLGTWDRMMDVQAASGSWRFCRSHPSKRWVATGPEKDFCKCCQGCLDGGWSKYFTLRCLFFGASSSVFRIERLLRTSNSLGFVMFDVDASQVVS